MITLVRKNGKLVNANLEKPEAQKKYLHTEIGGGQVVLRGLGHDFSWPYDTRYMAQNFVHALEAVFCNAERKTPRPHHVLADTLDNLVKDMWSERELPDDRDLADIVDDLHDYYAGMDLDPSYLILEIIDAIG